MSWDSGGQRQRQLRQPCLWSPSVFSLCAVDGPSSVQAEDLALVATEIHIQKQTEHRERSEMSGGP